MEERSGTENGVRLERLVCNTAVVGSGAAGWAAAVHLVRFGQKNVVLLTERREAGTSRNAGSDKQTYYKLSLAGEVPDSVRAMAETLFEGRCVDGDHALCEAALSTRCFFFLVELGVPFPCSAAGEYVGYKTDHDPACRASSAGPYTSRQMTECLEAEARRLGVPVLDRRQAIRVLTADGAVTGLLCLDGETGGYTAVRCQNVVFATGGPAGMYADTVFPAGQYGASGLAFEAGVPGKNLTEWQCGLASLRPRWNVSGSYMQVLPRFFSTDAQGGGEREFLSEALPELPRLLDLIFLKGYQWPFDARRVREGSSLLDVLVWREVSERKRRVFLDFTKNPGGGALPFDSLGPEAREYLARAGATGGTPYERLRRLNAPAADFYAAHGVDLSRQPLEIAECVQHSNGGLAVDEWWQTPVKGFFAVGEAAGTHGVCRPGGSALNAGQVGALRAAQFIAAHCPGEGAGEKTYETVLAAALERAEALRGRAAAAKTAETAAGALQGARVQMSEAAGPLRSAEKLAQALSKTRWELDAFEKAPPRAAAAEAGTLFRLRDTLLCQTVYLSAMLDYLRRGGTSRGSALALRPDGVCPPGLSARYAFAPDDGRFSDEVQEAAMRPDGEIAVCWRPVRPLPTESGAFETVWRRFRETGNIE